MGLLNFFTADPNRTAKPSTPMGILSPWTSPASLMPVVIAEAITGGKDRAIDRAQAMRTPAIAKARNLLVGQIARLPLRAYNGDDIETTPNWLFSTGGALSPWHRAAWTIDDLLFYGWSLWRVERGADGWILDAQRVAPDQWAFTPNGAIEIDNKTLSAEQVILIPSHGDGLLEIAGETIAAARDIEKSWQVRVKSPIPLVELHQTTNDYLSVTEAQDLVDTYAQARLDANGAITFTPHNVEIRVHGEASTDVLVEARNAIRLDVGNYCGLPAEILDGSLSTASLTYTTQSGARSELGDALRLWTGPVEARLSLDDVVPRGQRIRFDYTELEGRELSPIGPAVDD